MIRNSMGTKPSGKGGERTTAPVPRGICGTCGEERKLSRVTGDVTAHHDTAAGQFCEGSGEPPSSRVVATDRRRRPDSPVIAAPAGADLVTREEVAQICGVTIRTVTRWVGLGYLTRYEDSRGRVAYARVQAEAMNRFEPVE